MNELYAHHFEELARFCTMLYRDAEKGTDLAQETFLRALEHEEQIASLSPQEKHRADQIVAYICLHLYYFHDILNKTNC